MNMKTTSFLSTLAALLILLNISSISVSNLNYTRNSNSVRSKSGSTFILKNTVAIENKKKKELSGNVKHSTNEVSSLNTESEFDYLRFDVNKFVQSGDDQNSELPYSYVDFLRFDVNKYTRNYETQNTELPEADLDYLKFNVNTYSIKNPSNYSDFPENDLESLKFDVSRYYSSDLSSKGEMGELPSTE